MPLYKRTLPSGKVRLFVKGQYKGERYWQTVESEEEGRSFEANLQQSHLKRTQPRGIKLNHYFEKDYLPYCKRAKPANYLQEKQIYNRAIRSHFGEMTLGEIDPRMVRGWQLERTETNTIYKRPRKLTTVNKEIAVLSQIFSLAVADELLTRNPCAKVKRFPDGPHRVEYLTFDEEARLLAACTGARVSCQFHHRWVVYRAAARQKRIDWPEGRELRLCQQSNHPGKT